MMISISEELKNNFPKCIDDFFRANMELDEKDQLPICLFCNLIEALDRLEHECESNPEGLTANLFTGWKAYCGIMDLHFIKAKFELTPEEATIIAEFDTWLSETEELFK